MIAPMVVVIDKPANAGLKITRQVVVFQEDAVLERLMPAFDLALCLRMVGRAANVSHVLCSQPICQLSRDVAGTIIAEQARLMGDPYLGSGWSRERPIQSVGHALRLHCRAKRPCDNLRRAITERRID